MSFWEINEKGKKVFMNGHEAFSAAAEASLDCHNFRIDDENELVSDHNRSCYNCRYRRWEANGFSCLKS
jgi:hypothetical protein